MEEFENSNLSASDENLNEANYNSEEAGQKRKKRSAIWAHFTSQCMVTAEGREEYAHCIYCAKKYKVATKNSSTTGNLNKHIKEKHADKIVSDSIPAVEVFEFSQEKFRAALLKWVVLCDQPFTEIQQETFLEMVATLNPEAKVISETTLKRDLVALFVEKLKQIKLRMSNVPGKISFTMDGWTSKNVLSFLSIRAHFINADWKYESVLLDFLHVDGSHNGENFCTIFLDCLKRFDIPLKKVMCITMDNIFSNNTLMSSLEKHGIEIQTNFSAANNRVRCLTHILNLSVQDIMKSLIVSLKYEEPEDDDLEALEALEYEDEDEEDIDLDQSQEDENEEDAIEILSMSNKPTISKLRTLVKKVRKSPQMRQKLRKLCKLCGIVYLTPKIDVKTRWNSTFYMLERAATLKNPLRALCSSEKKLHFFLMNETEWAELNLLSTLLQKFDRATKLLSMERHPTIMAYLPTFYWLLDVLRSFIRDNPGSLAYAAEIGLKKLQKYEIELQIKNSKIPYFAVLLNPALKLNFFREHKFRNIKEIQKEFSDEFEREYESVGDDTERNVSEDPEDELYAFMYKRPKSTKSTKELQKYLQFPLSSHKINVLEFWHSHQADFPILSNMARDILPVQGASVAVERDFSHGADIVTPTRCSLIAETIRKLMCLKDWFKIHF